MDETSALAVTAVRAIETADRDRTLWSDADRAWASRAAAEVVGERAPAEAFLARRADLALERIGERQPAIVRTLAAFRWRGWIAPLVLAAAFVGGVAVDLVGSDGRINLLAPPVLGLIAWNLAVYATLLVRALLRLLGATRRTPGPLRTAVAKLAGAAPKLPRMPAGAPLGEAMTTFAADWSARAAPLYAARAARMLHLAAAIFAVGVIGGLWLRGLAFEYRASWQSTFLDAPQVHAILAKALAPGAALTGIAVPDVAHVASIRSTTPDGGENAARWLYLYAATILALVVVPRLVLALVDGWIERRRARSLAVPLDDPYYRRVLRGFRDGSPSILVVPYSFTVPDASSAGLREVATRLFGPRVRLVLASPVRYGAEDSLPASLVPADATVIAALFNATATPEAESHAAFAAALRRAAGEGRDAFAMVDETAFRERWPEDEARLAERRAAWSDVLLAARVPVVFVHLAHPDLGAAEAAIERALEHAP